MGSTETRLLYVANGSRYQIEVSYSYSKDETNETSSTGTGVEITWSSLRAGSYSTTNRVTSQIASIYVGVGNVTPVPQWRKKRIFIIESAFITVALITAEGKRQVLSNWEIDSSGKGHKSIIITEYGTVQFGYEDIDAPNDDWMWISSNSGINHRPRKFFVANASGKNITVQHVTSDGTPVEEDQCVSIPHKQSLTLQFDCVKITIEGSDHQPPRTFKPVPRTSLVVCRDHNVRDSTQLYGENIEQSKWIVEDELKDSRCMNTVM